MRTLLINDIHVDIDSKTSIGLNFQGYDVKNPKNRHVNTSNSFTVPATSKNLSIFGFANNAQVFEDGTGSAKVYEQNICNYFVGNSQFITDAKVRVDSIGERIGLFCYDKQDVWDEMKEVKWSDFVAVCTSYLGLPTINSPYAGKYLDFITKYSEYNSDRVYSYNSNYNSVCFPYAIGNLFKNEDENTSLNETLTSLIDVGIRYSGVQYDSGGHWFVYVTAVFEFIQSYFGVNFLIEDEDIAGNIWADEYVRKSMVPIRGLVSNYISDGENSRAYFETPTVGLNFPPLTNQEDKEDKTIYDFVVSFFQHFNVLVDDILIDGSRAFKLTRFNDLEETADVIDFSGKYVGTPKFQPTIPNSAQLNKVKFSEIYENGGEDSGSFDIENKNKNITKKADLFEIDAFHSAFFENNNGVLAPDLSGTGSFKTFSFFIVGDRMALTTLVRTGYNNGSFAGSASAYLPVVSLVDVEGEYSFLASIYEYPRFFEVQRWVNSYEINNIQFFKQYFIRELGGCFFINKILGFNPTESLKPTTLQLVKISDKIPSFVTPKEFWTDGLLNIFTDGFGNKFY